VATASENCCQAFKSTRQFSIRMDTATRKPRPKLFPKRYTWRTFRQKRFPAAGTFYHNNPQTSLEMSIKLQVRRNAARQEGAIPDLVITVEGVNGRFFQTLCEEACDLGA
jgi:hypothetical protein